MKAEINHMTRLFSHEKLQRIEDSISQQKGFGFELQTLSATVHGCIQKEELEVLNNKFVLYATKHQFQELREQIKEFVEKAEFQIMKHENEGIREEL